jgi:hypothetical protein
VVECLPSRHRALSSNSIKKEEEEEKEEEKEEKRGAQQTSTEIAMQTLHVSATRC